MTKRFLGHFLLLLAVLFAVKKSLDFTFGWVLAEVFARGTGCEVDLKNPRLYFFPLSASVEDVVIRHRSEPVEAGFRAERISIRLHFSNLLRRELLLTDLELRGTRAQSDGTDTGFIQTFAFLFPPKDPNAPPEPPPGAFKRWIKSWDFHIATIRIMTADAPNQLVIRFRGLTYLWDKVDVTFDEQGWDSKKPYDFTASGHHFRFRGEGLPDVPLGLLAGLGEIGHGLVRFKHAAISKPEPGGAKSEITGVGSLTLRAPGEYNLFLRAGLGPTYLREVFTPLVARDQNIPERLDATGELRGSFVEPLIGGHAQASFGPGALLPAREECGIRSISTDYQLNREGVRLTRLAIEDLSENSEAWLGFEGSKALQASLNFGLDRKKRWMESCFLSSVGKDHPGLYEAAVDSLADSRTSISVGGTLTPFELHGAVQSELSMGTIVMESKLNAEFHWTPAALDLKLREHGVIPQIQPDARSMTDDEAQKTTFHRAVNSNIELDLRYAFQTNTLELGRLHIVRYPTERILARIGPFIGESLYRSLLALPAENSLFDLDMKGETNFHDRAKLSGNVSATNIAPAGLPVDRLSLDVSADDNELKLQNATAEILGGTLRGLLSYRLAEQTAAGKLTASDVRLENLDGWRESAPDFTAAIDGEVRFNGPIRKLAYDGSFDIASARTGDQTSRRQSRIDVTGDSGAVRLKGTLLEPANRIDVLFPLSADESAEFQVDAELRDFPIHYFFPIDAESLESDGEAEVMEGGLSGTVHYRGPYRSPLLGEGSVAVTRLWLKGRGVTVEQADDLEASIHDGRMIFTNVRILTSGREVRLVGHVDHRDGWNARLAGRWELGTLLRSVDALEQTAGQVDVDLRITGEPAAPTIEGPVRLVDSNISLPLGRTIVGISNLGAEGAFSGHDLEFAAIEGRIGSSKLTGRALLRNIVGPNDLDLTSEFSFRGVALEPIDHLTFEIDGDLFIRSGPGGTFTLTGDISLRSGQYENVIRLTQALRALTRSIIGSETEPTERRLGQSEALENIVLDVGLHAPGGFLLDTNFAQAELRADLRLTGTAAHPLLDGKLEAIEGTFGVQSQEFEVLNAEASFFSRTNSLDPRISLIGETKVLARSGEEHHVRLLVTGTLTNPRVNFSSDSGLRPEEIQSLVGLGANFEALEFLHGGKRTRSFAEIINPGSGVSIEERLRSLTKFETVRIDTALSPATGEFVPRLIAKRPVARRVDLDIQSELGGRRSSSAELDYELTPYLSIIGGWRSGSLRRDVDQSSGQIGGGLHYRTTFPGFRLFSPQLTGRNEEEK